MPYIIKSDREENFMNKYFKILLSALCIAAIALTTAGCGKVEYTDSVITSEIIVPGEDDGDSASSGSGSTATDSKSDGNGNASSGTSSGAKTNKNLKGTTVKLLLWYKIPEREQSVLDAFTKKTGIKVKVTSVAEKNYMTTLSSRVASGASPDLVCILGNNYPTPIVRGLMQELDSKYFDINNKIYDKELMDAYKWGGKYYGVAVKGSMFGDMYCVFYNKTMFEERGQQTPYEIWKKNPNAWTWTKFYEVAKNMTYSTSAGQIYGFSIAYPQATMLSANTDFIKLSNGALKNNMSDAALKTAWKWTNTLKTDGCMMPGNAYYTDLTQGKVAMHIGGQWFMQKGNSFDTGMKDKWGVAPFPKQDNGDYYVPFRAALWGVPKNASNVAGAAACINYWLDPANEEKEVYASKECREVHNWLWSQKKGLLISQGIADFQKSGQFTEICNKLMTGANAVDTWLSSYAPAIDSCIAYASDALN